MYVITLQNLVEASIADPDVKRLSGNLRDPAALWKAENLLALEEKHRGVFAFLAFHPAADTAVQEYLEMGTLSSDAGKHILALFIGTPGHSIVGPGVSADGGTWLEIDGSEHPAYRLTRVLMGPNKAVTLPGLLVMERLSADGEPVFVSLTKTETAKGVLDQCRLVFALADQCYLHVLRNEGASFAAHLGARLIKEEIPHVRGGQRSPREWLMEVARVLTSHKEDLVTIAKLVA